MSTTEYLTAADGARLLLRSWPAPAERRVSMLIIHGLGEHSGRYEHVGAHFAAAGIAVSALDLRGFGRSDGKRAFVHSFAEYLADLEFPMEIMLANPAPTILYGHSLGGLVALAYALWGRRAPDLLVLSAPTLDAAIPGWKRVAARLLGRLVPGAALANDIRGDQLSSDPAVGEAYFADPLVVTRTTAGFGAEWLRAMAKARASLAHLTVPTLVIHGGEDTLVPPPFSEALTAIPGVTRLLLPGLRHECHNEMGGEVALGEIGAWIDRQLGGEN
ncbi:MAG TPA: lysophospholipase [Acidimicrobiia bacterium]|nr:lysophospholipase [Acidimicrobiia bacterium]